MATTTSGATTGKTTATSAGTTTAASVASATRSRVARVRPALRWLPVALLLGVAALHVVLVRSSQLHPWLGGGFGMFSTVDERHLLAWRVGREGEELLELPYELEDAAERAEALPTEARLGAIARALATEGAVRVEVWEMRFGPAMEREPRLLRAVDGEPAPAEP